MVFVVNIFSFIITGNLVLTLLFIHWEILCVLIVNSV
jgi:hypothetical protein